MDTVIEFAALLYSNVLVKAVLGLLAANVVAGIAAALYTRTFRLAALGDWLITRAVPYLLGAGTVQLVLLTLPPEWSGLSSATGNAVWLFVVAALIGHTLDALRDIGLPIPATLTDVPKLFAGTRTVLVPGDPVTPATPVVTPTPAATTRR